MMAPPSTSPSTADTIDWNRRLAPADWDMVHLNRAQRRAKAAELRRAERTYRRWRRRYHAV